MARQRNSSAQQKTVRITGWENSKASKDQDGGVGALLSFVTKKAHGARIISHNVNGNTIFLQASVSDASKLLACNNYTFAGVKISIQESSQNNQAQSGQNRNNQQNNQTDQNNQNSQSNQSNRNDRKSQKDQNQRQDNVASNQTHHSSHNRRAFGNYDPDHGNKNQAPPPYSADEIENVLVSVIRNRYRSHDKFLNLACLPKEPDFQAVGLERQPASKVFAALFVCCEKRVFETQPKRQQLVESLSLADNGLVSVKEVITAANTFNGIKNLDLSANRIKDVQELRYWRNKFPDLQHLILTNNPIDDEKTKQIMLQWYPKLTHYNNAPVGAAADVPIVLDQTTGATSEAPHPKPTEVHPEFPPDSTFAVLIPGKTEEQCVMEQLELRFSYETMLKMSFAREAMVTHNYAYDKAMEDFRQLVQAGKIPNEAFLRSTC